eukprot:1092376-Pleurochrysis_carterae.AAC.1
MVTPSNKVTEIVDSIKTYITETEDWIHAEVLFTSHEHESGHLLLEIWCTVNHPAHEILPIFHAKSRLLMFIQAYMQASGIDYVKPLQPTRLHVADAIIDRLLARA